MYRINKRVNDNYYQDPFSFSLKTYTTGTDYYW